MGRGAAGCAPTVAAAAFSLHHVGQRRRTEVDAEPPAPDRYRAILAQVQSLGHVVVVATDVSLQGAQIHDACPLRTILLLYIACRDEIEAHVGAFRACELPHPQPPSAILCPIDLPHAPALLGVRGGSTAYR